MSECRHLHDKVVDSRMQREALVVSDAIAHLGRLHDMLGEMVVCRDEAGTILFANQTFRAVTGCQTPDGRSCEEIGLTFRPGQTRHAYEVEVVSKGLTRLFHWQDVLFEEGGNGAIRIQSIARDVTEERLEASRREQARRVAEDESRAKSRLIAMVSHEIRTPLSGLLGMGQLLAGTRLNAEQKNYLEGIRQSGTALAHLVEDLLDFSTLSAGRFHLRPRREPIRPLIENMVELLASRAHAKGIEIAATVAPTLPETLTFDPARLRQVLYNVVGNAVKFTETGGVMIDVSLADFCLDIAVSDTGPGMTAAERRRIFGEFEQGDLHRAREGGVGLGLAISARIVAEAGGEMSVASDPGVGSVFSIRLPAGIDTEPMRTGTELIGANVLVIAPEGPAARGLVFGMRSLGAKVEQSPDVGSAQSLPDLETLSDVIVDHRLSREFARTLSHDLRLKSVRKIFLVTPESRPEVMTGDVYDGWLIRPLREQSLIDVLTDKFEDLEARWANAEQFPVLAAPPTEEANADQPEPMPSILLGEDDPVNAMIVRATLERAGYRVRHADSFARLERLQAQEGAAVILTDNSMPDGTSDGFIGRLRDREESASLGFTPVVVLTADTRDEVRHALLARGASLVLFKPAPPDALIGAIADIAARRA